MKKLYKWYRKFSFTEIGKKYISYQLLYLVVIFVLCSCWPSCERGDVTNPIRRKDYKGRLREYDSLLQSIPNNIGSLPRLIIGQVPAFVQIDKEMGCVDARPQDITVDREIKEYLGPTILQHDIEGDAWDTDTILKIKAHTKYQGKFSAIIFERIGVLPLYWGKYLQAFFAQPINGIYQFPDDLNTLVDIKVYRTLVNNRFHRKNFYSKGLSIFHDLARIPVSVLQLPSVCQIDLIVDPESVILESPRKYLFEKGEEEPKILPLEPVITSTVPEENTILQDYYDLLAPGGLLIFSSSANGINRYGVIVEYQGKQYTPFQDLDDPKLQAVYRSVFERAGFINVQFYKDPYFAEDVILLVAQKL